ncbi:hypothetical protein RSSM_03481 [Rhodopirellula sallentina SM41]|uniref:Uncharacterized protein n=1 Tax=Rhodopirellula sallentina SM41 TaxID=1263870 RepID=M5U130_9BACT|nr:hypothetical protein RSSM_03481 [Rhodopirellula sallentina SM41]
MWIGQVEFRNALDQTCAVGGLGTGDHLPSGPDAVIFGVFSRKHVFLRKRWAGNTFWRLGSRLDAAKPPGKSVGLFFLRCSAIKVSVVSRISNAN